MKKHGSTTKLSYAAVLLTFLMLCSQLLKAQSSRSSLAKEDLVFFAGDSLIGFPIENEYAKCKQLEKTPGALYEYKYVLKQREARFVKQKYHIDKLPVEIATEKLRKQNTKPTITPQTQQAYRQDNPPRTLASSCNNIDFEDGNFTNWVGYEGYNESTNNPLTTVVGPLGPPPTNLNSAETSCQYFSIISNGSTDPNMGIVLTSPLGGDCARMGGENRNLANDPAYTTCTGTGNGNFNYTVPSQCVADYFGVNIGDQVGLEGAAGEVLETTFTVTTSNSAFKYAYLFAYADNGSHDTTQQPYFKVQVLDHLGNEINCLNYFQQGLGNACGSTHAPPGYSGSLATGLFYTSNWQVSSLNLLPYLNQGVTVRFTVAGCTVGGHFGYAYVDCSCAPQQIIIPYTACQGANTTLIAPPLGGAVYQWTTSNGAIVSGATNDTVIVSQSGTYSVSITPTKTSINGAGNVVTQTLTPCAYFLDTTITLFPNPVVSVNSATLCSGTTANLNVTSTGGAGALTYSWSTTSGLTFTSGDTIAAANPASSTIYTVTGVSAHGCKDTAVSNVVVNIEPPPTFTAPAVCLGTPTTFSNTVVAGDTYDWNFGDSHTLADTANIANPSYTYTYSGTFSVSFSVTTAGGCKSNTTQTVVVNSMPVIHFTANHPCDGSAVNFTNTTPSQGSFSTWHWDLGDGDTNNTASPGAYTYTAPAGFSAAGCYSVVLTGTTTTGCSGSFDTTVYVHNNPFAYFNAFEACMGDASEFVDSSFIQNPACLNDQITSWNYDFGDGQTANNTAGTLPDTIKHTYAICGAYNITATVTTNNSCTYTNTIIGDTVFCLPVVTGPSDFSVCPGSATPVQDFSTVCGNGGTPYAEWFQSLTNVNNTGAPASFINPGGIDQVPSYNPINPNLSCNILSDTVFAIAVSGVGCVGNAVYYVANVFPTPYLAHMPSDTVCSDQLVTVPDFTACPSNSTITWTVNNPRMGLNTSGTGNIGSFTSHNMSSINNLTAQIDAVATANGCVGPDSSFTIVVRPVPTITISSDTSCPGGNIPSPTIVTSPATNVTYSWTVSNNTAVGMPASGSGLPGSYTAPSNTTLVNQDGIITYTPSLNGCLGTPATATVTVRPTPYVTPMPNEFYCPNDIVPQINFSCTPTGGTPVFSYSGVGGIGITQIGSIQSFTATNPSSLPIVSTVSVNATLNGCQGPNTTFSITVFPNPVANFSYTPVCEGLPVLFTDQSTVGGGISIATWQWDMNNDGVIDITGQHIPPYAITPAGTHSVTLLVTTNSVPSCSAQTTEPVIIYPNPHGDFVGVDLNGCSPVNTSFTYLAGGDTVQIAYWNWNFGDGQTFSAPSPAGQFPKSQDYTNASALAPKFYSTSLIVTSYNGCKDTISKSNYIEVYPKPIPGFSWGPKDANLYEPTITFVNQAIGANTFTPALTYGPYGVQYYLSDDYLTGSASNYMYNNTSFSHSYNNPDYADVEEQYPVKQCVINSYGCKDSIIEIVTIQPIVTFYIPNAFTPNGDGVNEGFKGTGIGIKDNTYNLWIFDRWGLMIYHADGLEKAWDGHMQNHEGQPILQEDVYVWKVKFDDILGKEHDYHGTVTLVK